MAVKKHKSLFHQTRPIRFILLGFVGLGLVLAELLRGTDVVLFNPKGYIAQEQFNLMLISLAVMAIIAVPALFLFYFFAWKYRESNKKATYDPNGDPGKSFVVAIWVFPAIIAIVLAGVMWPATHRLEPNDAIAANAKPITIQVVAMRWKWLFIYPEQKIATVNFVQIPTDTPVEFKLTADESPMSSFWIPHLAGQLYAMTGHSNQLNVIADTPGDYPGSSAEINGAGFAGMKFITRAGSQADFDQWVHDVELSTAELDAESYQKLLSPSENHPTEFYSLADAGLYDKVLMKYMGAHGHTDNEQGEHQGGYKGADDAPEKHHTRHE
jgi:cytochrome o ubiquinol oxidase subunit II